MPGNWPKDIEQHGTRYQLLEPLTGISAHLRFEGTFEDRSIVWDARVLALGPLPENGARRAYLDIGPDGPDTTPIEVGLDVTRLDEAVILRTIIMVRQYKRLRRGRMAFGASL